MKFKTPAVFVILTACFALGSSGCSLFHHHKAKSGWKIVGVDDDSPFITDAPTRAGTITRTVDVHTDPAPQQNR